MTANDSKKLFKESVQTKTLPDDRQLRSFGFATPEDLDDLDMALEGECHQRIYIPEIFYMSHRLDTVPLGYEYP